MTYSKKKIPVYDIVEGYDKVSSSYQEFDRFLDKWHGEKLVKFFPRDMSGMKILDVGAGSGRMYKYFQGQKNVEYIACDISASMMKKIPSSVTKIVCDVEDNIPLSERSVDLVLMFFVLIHLRDCESLFRRLWRILNLNGRIVIFHHEFERSYVHHQKDEKFIIQEYHYSYETIIHLLEKVGFDVYVEPVYNKDVLVGNFIVADKP